MIFCIRTISKSLYEFWFTWSDQYPSEVCNRIYFWWLWYYS